MRHFPGKLPPDILERAKPSCKICYGTGDPGRIVIGDRRAHMTCRCVVKASVEKVTWLKEQPWLEEKDEDIAEPERNPELENG